MTDKQLKDKAVDIKGKKYVLVSDRVLYFNETYPNGSIVTKLVSPFDNDLVVIKANIMPDSDKPNKQFTGYSQAKWGDGYINKTSALENAETSAVGRALAMMGIGVIESIASIDEINKAENTAKAANYASVKQIQWMREEAMRATGIDPGPEVDEWIEKTVGMRPNLVPSKAVKGAIDKIRDKQTNVVHVHEVGGSDTVIEVTDDILKKLDSGEIPY